MDWLEAVERAGVIPVAMLESEEEAWFLAGALEEAGLPIIEVAFRTAAAAAVIRYLRRGWPALCVGAGTVLTPAQAEQAFQAGACFIVSPGLDEGLAARCQSLRIPWIPGVATPTEIMVALRLGLTVLKFFPAEAMGGTKTLSALMPLFPDVRFIPTGGHHLPQPRRLSEAAQRAGLWGDVAGRSAADPRTPSGGTDPPRPRGPSHSEAGEGAEARIRSP